MEKIERKISNLAWIFEQPNKKIRQILPFIATGSSDGRGGQIQRPEDKTPKGAKIFRGETMEAMINTGLWACWRR